MSGTIERLHLIMGLVCNVRCVMCYQRDFSSRRNMPSEIFTQHLRELYPKVRTVKIQGGEPTIMANCRQFARLARAWPGMRLSVVTNGVRVSDFWQQTFLEQGQLVHFSVNAATAQTYERIVRHGDFKAVLKNLERLLAARQAGQPQVAISAVVLGANALELTSFIALGQRLGVDKIGLMVDPMLSFANLPEPALMEREVRAAWELAQAGGVEVEGLHSLARRLGLKGFAAPERTVRPVCPLPFNSLVVDEAGDARVCCDTWKVLGNTYRQPIQEILEGPTRLKFQQMVRSGDYSWCPPHCPDNPAPRRTALLGKYLDLARRDPADLWDKVREKMRRRRQLS